MSIFKYLKLKFNIDQTLIGLKLQLRLIQSKRNKSF